MRVLTLNVGSSSLKWSRFQDDTFVDGGARETLDEIATRAGAVDAVAHRVVHGGARFSAPAIVDDDTLRALDEITALDPLHMRPAVAMIRAARARFPRAEHVAVFDTAFHATMPREATTYAVPRAWRDRGVRRYGFHGLSVAWSVERLATLAPCPIARAIVLHLGSGSSATAVRDGRSVDTTMGMTPLDGLIMATRAGSIDPGAIVHLARNGVSLDEVDDGLTNASGLVALAGDRDMRAIAERAARGDEAAIFARAMVVHSIARNASALLASLDGLDALVFTGGIGENDGDLRARVCDRLAFAGVALDAATSGAPTAQDRIVSTGSSRAIVAIVHAREDLMLARAALRR